MHKNSLKLGLQFFAEQGAGDPPPQPQPQDPTPQPQNTPPAIDYDKIQQMLNGTLAAKEETALKAYFKQQGLSQQEAEQAMSAFKEQKAKNQPDIGAMQTQLAKAQQLAQQAQIQNAATMAAVELGIDAKTIPYVLKMADFSNATGENGTVNAETLKAAINKVLEDVPALKPQVTQNKGFTQIGAENPTGPAAQTTSPQPTATKRWNRFN